MKKTIINILNELRTAILLYFFFIFACFIVCYINRFFIYKIITNPITTIFNKQYNLLFIYTSIFESFAADLFLSFCSSIFLSLPFLFICIYFFLEKSLYKFEKRILAILLFLSLLLVFISALMVYYFLLPHFIKFFAFYANNATPMFKIIDYVKTFFYLIFAISIMFQFPIILFILSKFNLIKKDILAKYRKFAIVIIFIISAIITPPDVISQIFVSLIMMSMYEMTNYILQRKN